MWKKNFYSRKFEKQVHFVAKKLKKDIISDENRLDFLIHTACHPEIQHSKKINWRISKQISIDFTGENVIFLLIQAEVIL